MTTLMHPAPILRMFDVAKAREFYIEYLSFNVDWEHRFEPKLPLYMSVTRGGCTLHLTEHHGDCCPGAALRIPVDDIAAFHAEIMSKDYDYLRPSIELTLWDTREVSVNDPFHNRLTFFKPLSGDVDETETVNV